MEGLSSLCDVHSRERQGYTRRALGAVQGKYNGAMNSQAGMGITTGERQQPLLWQVPREGWVVQRIDMRGRVAQSMRHWHRSPS